MELEGIIYVLTNPAMPRMVKIGMTTRDEVAIRMNELYTTGVPLPFECSFAGKTNNLKQVEKALHIAFGPQRINPKREFFEIEENQVIELLKVICSEEVTPEINNELAKIDEDSKNAGKRYKAKRPNLNFEEMQIAIGERIDSASNEDFCTIHSKNKVLYKEEIMSLTRATKLSLDNSYNVAPCPQWNYMEKNLSKIYAETYDDFE